MKISKKQAENLFDIVDLLRRWDNGEKNYDGDYCADILAPRAWEAVKAIRAADTAKPSPDKS